tara:strand:- start:12961 stop:13206 length:246 start_codon:yes stop_codon:yes gene_type:complete
VVKRVVLLYFMTKEARTYWALMAVLVTIALTSFTVQEILSSDTNEEVSNEITGNAMLEAAEVEDVNLNGALVKVSNRLEES